MSFSYTLHHVGLLLPHLLSLSGSGTSRSLVGPFPLSAFLDDLFLLEMQGKKVLNSYTFSLQKLSEREQREEELSMLSFLLSVFSAAAAVLFRWVV